jgi:hypothetical protein
VGAAVRARSRGPTSKSSGSYPSSGDRRRDGQDARASRSRALLSFPRDDLSTTEPRRHCDLLSLFGAVDDGALDDALDDVDPDDGLVLDVPDDDGIEDVLGAEGELLDDVLGVDDVPPVPDVDDDIDPLVDGGVVAVDDDEDGDGDGVTVGGVVDDVFVSRWQPATPSARPVQSSVTKVTRLIGISEGFKGKRCAADLAGSVPRNGVRPRVDLFQFRLKNSDVSDRLRRMTPE